MKEQEQLILEQIQASMAAHGWPLLSMFGLKPCFSKDVLVTPYFGHVDVHLRPFGSYLIEGLIGVIHQGFEKLWTANPDRDPKVPGFAAGLLTANFLELAPKYYIHCNGPFTKEVDAFCEAVVSILGRMPNNEQQLIAAFEGDSLCDFPVNAFAGYSHRKKFEALKEFVKKLAVEHADRLGS